jgi:hypothetical protein
MNRIVELTYLDLNGQEVVELVTVISLNAVVGGKKFAIFEDNYSDFWIEAERVVSMSIPFNRG